MQVLYQLANGTAGLAYSFVISFLILIAISQVPGLELRSAKLEKGLDEEEIGETAYLYVDEALADYPRVSGNGEC